MEGDRAIVPSKFYKKFNDHIKCNIERRIQRFKYLEYEGEHSLSLLIAPGK